MCSCGTSLLLHLLRWGSLSISGEVVAGRPGELSWHGEICVESSLGYLDGNTALA